MAIKIPSKNIYEINNPKIRDNVIDNVSIEQTVVSPNNEYDIVVYRNTYKEFYDNEQPNNYSFKSVLAGGNGTPWGYSLSYSGYKKHKFLQNTEIKILTTLKNKYISDLILGERDGFSNIKYGIYGVKTTANVSCNYNGTINDNIGEDTISVSVSIEDCVFSNQQTTPIQQYNIPNELSYTADYDKDYGGGLTIEVTSNVKAPKLDNLNVASYDIEEINGKEYFVITIKDILCGVETYQMKNSAPSLTTSISGKLEGEYCKYEPSYIELNIYGNTIGIELTNGSVTYGSGNKPYSLSGNELLQDSANSKTDMKTDSVGVKIGGESRSAEGTSYLEMFTTHNFNIGDIITNFDGTETAEIDYYDSSDGYYEIKATTNGYFYQNMQKDIIVKYSYYQQERLTQHLANDVLSQYAKGKETATLLCSISDYYDESGEKVIDTKTNKMSFRLHDEVIPYVYGADGKDKPMSKTQDGSAKVFEVVDSNIIYDGAVWQELTLLEKTQNN